MKNTTNKPPQTARPRCCMCKQPTPNPAHEATGPKRYHGWAPGRYTSVHRVWCASCWQELERANQKYHEDLMADTARKRADGEIAMVKQILLDLKLRRPHGNVAHYWLRAGLVAAAHWLDQRASNLRQVATGMTSEYDDPSLLAAHANAMEDAAHAIRAMAQKTTKQRKRR